MYIYILTDGEYHKIGVSKDPRRRVKQLQTASAGSLSIIKTYNVPSKIARKLEQQLHKMFWQRRKRFNGEWFNLTQQHLDVIDEWLANYTVAEQKLN